MRSHAALDVQMPYVACPICSALTYVPRSFLADPQHCPACDRELDRMSLLPISTGRAGSPAGAPASTKTAPRDS
jgi:hypothetical protein